MKKLLFANFWVTVGLMMLVTIVDLIALPISNFGVGFVITFIYFLFGIIIWNKDKE